MRRLLLLAAASSLLLGGCNLVMAELPILTAEDARGAPQLKPGVWLSRDPDCAVDTSKPMKDWPACAKPSVITADRIGGPPGSGGGMGASDSEMAYVLAGGDPQVMQFEFQMDPAQPKLYMFVGLDAQRTDEAGRIIEARTWLVQCGPPPPPMKEEPTAAPAESAESLDEPMDDPAAEALDAESAASDEAGDLAPEAEAPLAEDATADLADDAGSDTPGASEEPTEAQMEAAMKEIMASGVTTQPLPGLILQDGVCLVRTIEPLRNAARESLQWDTAPPTVIYWVRDKAD